MNILQRLNRLSIGVICLLGVSLSVYASPQRLPMQTESDEATYTPSILLVEDEAAVENLKNQGVIIWRVRGDMALALVPDAAQSSKKLKGVKRIERGHRAVPTMDIARKSYNAEYIHNGIDLEMPYNGKGVVVGMCDTGFDPNHIAFKDSAGNSRIRRLVYYDERHAVRKVMETTEEIAAWTTDEPEDYHGTHVCNIMAGGYREAGYHGMAPDADIVACTSLLYDVGILAACEDIIEYAQSVDKPAVINISVGSYNGPRDGTSLFCRYLDLLGLDAIICISAGNEGTNNATYRASFTADKPDWRMLLYSSDWAQFDMYGMVDAWSHDARPVGIRLHVYDGYTNKTVYSCEKIIPTDGFEQWISSSSDAEFAKYFQGDVVIYGGLDSFNNRWNTNIEYLTNCPEADPNSNGTWARYLLETEFFGEDGVNADISADCVYTWPRGRSGYPGPSPILSISDMCTGQNVVSVGMYTTRNSSPSLTSDTPYTQDNIVGNVHTYSSYGTLVDHRVLPLTVAPGSMLISACNSYFVDNYPSFSKLSSYSEVDGKKYYWVSETGTSMSSPYTAGTIACWLEANPKLNIEDIKYILAHTNATDVPNPNDPRHGQGWLQPYDGLKYMLATSNLPSGASAESSAKPSIKILGDSVDIFNPAGKSCNVTVYNLSGTTVIPSFSTTQPVSTISLSSLKSGVYVITLTSVDSAPVMIKFIR